MPQHTPAPTPSRAVYGFVLYLTFNIFFLLYMIWAIIPEDYFRQIGVDFLPERHWAVSVPIYLLTVLTVFAFVIYPSLGLLMTPNVDDLHTISDSYSSRAKGDEGNPDSSVGYCVCKDKENCWREYYLLGRDAAAKKKLPVINDLNIWDVSEHLYL